MGILIRLVITSVALWVATALPGIGLEQGSSTAAKVGTLVAVAILFGVINAVLKPIIHIVGCGLYVLTLGLIALVVNGGLFWLTGWLAKQLDLPFVVENFWPASILGALVVGLVSWALGMLVPDPEERERRRLKREVREQLHRARDRRGYPPGPPGPPAVGPGQGYGYPPQDPRGPSGR